MGLLQKALETYQAMGDLVGVEREEAEMLSPIGHMIAKACIEITLDESGHFVEAKAIDKKIPIPVTEASASRSGKDPAPHALCDKIDYLTGEDQNKYHKFMEQLTAWNQSSFSADKTKAIQKYLQSCSIKEDLKKSGLLKDKMGSNVITWRIVGLGENSGAVYNDCLLQQKYGEYYLFLHKDDPKQLCMIDGKTAKATSMHLKGIFANSGNAKIISSNDTQNFTYLGRFLSDEETLTVSYEVSQKAHNALKWLVANQGVIEGNRVFVCWNPHGIELPKIDSPFIMEGEEKYEPTQYREELKKRLNGLRSTLKPDEDVVLAAFEAATTGRLSIAYYSELKAEDFLSRLEQWDSTCCWYDSRWGCSSPSLYSILQNAYGTLRGEKMDVDDKIIPQQMQRLIHCRIDQAKFPADMVRSIVQKAENLQIYPNWIRERLLFTACAVVYKYYKDYDKGEICMGLEENRPDRSYQFGRLLSVMEKIERDTFDSNEKREPNAIRMQQTFVKRPGYATQIIMTQLKNAYYPRLSVAGRVFYDRLIGDIMDVLSAFADDYDKPLTETYLLGYYLQKNELYTKKENGGK